MNSEPIEEVQINERPATWRKNLYSNVGYNDNYTDVSFLEQLRTNVNQKKVSFQEAVLGSARVTEQLCVVSIFVAFYLFLISGVLHPNLIFIYSTTITTLCYILYLNSLPYKNYKSAISAHSKTVAIFFIFGHILSPVLKTLTDTISTDTINATTTFMMLLHLIFFDYKVPAAIVSSALSTNAAIFGSLCLASRLPSSFHAFILLTISVECFVLYPPFVYSIRKAITLPYIIMLILSTVILLASVNIQMVILFVILCLLLNGLCPYLFVKWRRYKHNIYGPWDEAVIKDSNLKNKNS